MIDQEAIPPAVLRLAQALIASGLDLGDTDVQPKQQRQKPYRVAEVAAALDVHKATVYRDIETGRCEAYRIGAGSGAIRITVEDFENYKACVKAKAVTRQSEGAA